MTANGRPDHDEMRDQVGVYVLGALTAAERTTFEAHLASCADCAGEVRSLLTIAGVLAFTAPQTDPPAGLRARVLSGTGAGADVLGGKGTSREATGRPRPAVLPPTAQRRAGVTAGMPWLAAAASIVLAVVLGAYTAALRGRIGDLEARLRDANDRVNLSERSVADARREIDGARRVASEVRRAAAGEMAVLAAPDLQRIDLGGQSPAPRAVARAFWSRSRGLVFTAANLPVLPPGRTYQLWVLSKQAPPYGTNLLLKPEADGRVTALFDTPRDLPQPTQMAVTIEPEGGVPAPTGDMYLVGAAH